MEPINYLSQVADPFAQATQGLRLGAGMVELQQKQAAAEQQKLATQQYNQALLRLQSPKATAADFENMIMISGKDQAANLKTVMESRNCTPEPSGTKSSLSHRLRPKNRQRRARNHLTQAASRSRTQQWRYARGYLPNSNGRTSQIAA
jgi:hypothetical protein